MAMFEIKKLRKIKRVIAAAAAAATAVCSIPAGAESLLLEETEIEAASDIGFEDREYVLVEEGGQEETTDGGESEPFMTFEPDSEEYGFAPIEFETDDEGGYAEVLILDDSEPTDEFDGENGGIETVSEEDVPEPEEEEEDIILIEEEETSETESDADSERPLLDEETDVSGDAGFAAGFEVGTSGSMRRLMAGGSSTFTNYGSQLTANEKATYDAFVSNWLGGSTTRFDVVLKNPLSFTVTDEIDDAYVKGYGYRSNPEYASCKELIKGYVQAGLDAFIYDYPEVFWFSKVSFAYENLSRESGSYSENPDGSTTLTIRKFSITSPFLFWTDAAEQTGAFRSAVSAAVSEVSGMIPGGASTGMKAKILADYVRQICDYEEGTYSHVAYGVFCGGGKAVCEGYAKAFKILCDRFGIDCALVPGELTVNGAAEPHMWTAVKTDDGLWRIVDPTLNDSSMNKTAYTLVGTETEIGSRTIAQQRSAYDAFSDTPYARIFLTPPIAADAYHERTETFREEPTCEENGSSTEECVIHDGETIEAEIPATGHSFSEWKTVKAAACEEPGTQERTCSACSKKEAREIPAAGHSFSAWKTSKTATCTESGTQERTCAGCGKKETKTVPATGVHVSGDWETIKPATCLEDGIRMKKCLQCGKETAREPIPKKTYCSPSEWETVKEATCAESGIKIRKCSVCGKETDRQTIPKTSVHSFGEWRTTKAATCAEPGTQERTCSVCSRKETKTIPATGIHVSGAWETMKAATCAETGIRVRKCSTCGKETARETVPKTDSHSPSAWKTTKAATCSESGIQVKTCGICGKELERKQIPALGHSFTQWTDSKRASIKAGGTQTRTCSRCGKKETRSVAKLNPFATPAVKSLVLTKGQKYRIGLSYAYGDSVKNWTSSRKSVATVSKNGTVKAVKAGKCSVTVVMKSGKKASVKITVKNPTTKSLSVSAKGLKNGKATIRKGKSLKLNVKKNPSNSADKIKFSTSSSRIASVSSNGTVKGKRAGTAKITVKSGKATTVLTITVR